MWWIGYARPLLPPYVSYHDQTKRNKGLCKTLFSRPKCLIDLNLCRFSSSVFEPSPSPEGCQPLFWSPPPINPWPTPPDVGATVVRAAYQILVRCTRSKSWCTVPCCVHPLCDLEQVWGAWVRYAQSRIRPTNVRKNNSSVGSKNVNHLIIRWWEKTLWDTDWMILTCW